MNSKDIKSCIYFHQLIPHLHFLPSSCCCLLNNSSYFDNNDKLFVLKYKFFVPFSPYDVVQFFWELSKTAKKIVQEIWHFLSEFLSSEMPFTLVGKFHLS
ncbi:hypothetical protein AABB24_010573 [Solanum stoloniferum]|uniref:Uncharacterized protein n=1 Tax=Solanum stoloniferum TaxID=62892 RepID=A0ABD2UAU0_9SOLN